MDVDKLCGCIIMEGGRGRDNGADVEGFAGVGCGGEWGV